MAWDRLDLAYPANAEAPRRGELATLGLFVNGPRLEDMAEMGAGVGDTDIVAIKTRQPALEMKRQSRSDGWQKLLFKRRS